MKAKVMEFILLLRKPGTQAYFQTSDLTIEKKREEILNLSAK